MGDRWVVMIKTTRNGKPWMKIVANKAEKWAANTLAEDYRDQGHEVIVRKVGKRKKKKKKGNPRKRVC